MRYALLIYYGEDTAVSDRDRQRREKQCTATCDRLRARGVLMDTQLLLPSRAARVVRCWDGGDITVTSGPAALTREQLTGWVVADCEDLDAAVRLATTIPAAWHGSVEIRPAGQILTRSVCQRLFGGGPAVAPRSGHYGRMGLLCDYFTAASNAQAAETIDWIGGPANPPRPSGLVGQMAARPTVSLPGIEPTTWMGKLEEILTGRSFDDILQDPTGQVISSRDGGERLIIPLTARLQDALASIDDDTVDEVAAQWAAPDEYYVTSADTELAAGALIDLIRLVRAGRERAETLYCWVCV